VGSALAATAPGLETTAARAVGLAAGLATGLAAGLTKDFLISDFFSSSAFLEAVVTLAVAGLAVAAGLTPLDDEALSAATTGLLTPNLAVAGLPATPFVLTATGA